MNHIIPGGRTGTVLLSIVGSAVVIGFLRKSAMKETTKDGRNGSIAVKLGLVDPIA